MESKKVLIVEDEVIVALDLKKKLENLDYVVLEIVSSGEEAINKTIQLAPDLVLMDIMLEDGMDGVQATEQIRKLYDIPVVFVSAFSDEKNLQRAKITEPYGYIIKPFNARELRTTIEIALYKHEMERQIKESRLWFMTILKSINDAVITVDTKERITFMNPTAEVLTGWNLSNIMGKTFSSAFTLVNEDTGARIDSPILEVMEQKKPLEISEKNVLVNMNQNEIPIESSAVPIINEQGNITDVVFIFRDITRRKRSQELLRIKDRAMATSVNAIAITDLQGYLTYVNHSFLRLWGYENESEILGKLSSNFWHLEEKAMEIIEGFTGEESWIGNISATKKDGERFKVELSATIVTDDYGHPVCMLTSFVDFSDRK